MSEDKRTATQRIEDLEKVASVLYQNLIQMKNITDSLMKSQGDMGLIKEATRLLNKKLEAVVQLSKPETGVSAESVSNLVLKMNVEDLTSQVAEYVKNGHLVSAEEVSPNSYLVCEEYNPDGTLANPRIQFRLDSQEQSTSDAFKGKKAGDTVSFGENKFSAKILEIYTLVEPKQETAPAAEAATPVAPVQAGYVAPAFAAPDTMPQESPVPQFVPSEPGMMATAGGNS